jgi:hypothetical protein
MLKPQIGSQLWKNWMLKWVLIELGKQLETIKMSVKQSLGSTKDVQNY